MNLQVPGRPHPVPCRSTENRQARKPRRALTWKCPVSILWTIRGAAERRVQGPSKPEDTVCLPKPASSCKKKRPLPPKHKKSLRKEWRACKKGSPLLRASTAPSQNPYKPEEPLSPSVSAGNACGPYSNIFLTPKNNHVLPHKGKI